jgi:MYXO-CTERM domain-containing protein
MTMRRPRWGVLLVLATLVGVGSAQGATTDLEVINILVFDESCTNPPVTGEHLCVKVEIRNNGPGTYDGDPGKPGLASPGNVSISVDIDEPSKPGPDGAIQVDPGARILPVTPIPPGGTLLLTYGPVGYWPYTAGTHHARATVTALVDTDPDSNNNTLTETFVVTSSVPATGPMALALGAAAILAFGLLWLRRRRQPLA